jgi:glycosyltransferase involved in cell wall biosynthesis
MQLESNNYKIVIIIPVFNEEEHISNCVDSLLNQNYVADKIILVDDGSTDASPKIICDYAEKNRNVQAILAKAEARHEPGAKVINAFKRGLENIRIEDYDIICKFDADLEFPEHYLKQLAADFSANPKIGLCGGVCSILSNGEWQTEELTNSDHVRGALKAYRVKAFEDISGLQSQMGWDTADEFKLRYKNWEVRVDQSLKVKHFKPTASSYQNDFFNKQGEVFYALRYGIVLTIIAALKIAFRRNELTKIRLILDAYRKASIKKVETLLSKEEGKYLRKYRWQGIIRKFIP